VRLKLVPSLLGLSLVLAPFAEAQRPDTMMPEQSEAKGKQLIKDLINAFGGAGYTEVTETQCQGRRAQFGHNGEMTGYIDFVDERRLPDKDRTEYIAKGHNSALLYAIGIDGLDIRHGGVIITLYNGDEGWTLDRGGVSEMPATAVSDFQAAIKLNIDYLLRSRLNEPGLSIRYGGSGIVDLKPAEWIEITDNEGRVYRLAIERLTHLLIRSVVTTDDPETNQRNEDVTIYSNYQLRDSVWTPLQVSREHNGRRSAQFFYDTCKFNPGFPSDLFTKASLSKHYSEAASKKNK
jgi:hypothetical protein